MHEDLGWGRCSFRHVLLQKEWTNMGRVGGGECGISLGVGLESLGPSLNNF